MTESAGIPDLETAPEVPPRPEEDVAASARDEPVAGGIETGEPAQGEGAADSY